MNTNIAFLFTFIAGCSTIIGSLIVFLSNKRTLNFLIGGISFASSVMFFLSIFDLIPESMSFLSYDFKLVAKLLICFIFLCTGVCLSIILDKLFPNTFNEKSLYKLGIITMIGIMLHNIPEDCSCYVSH